MAGVVLIESTLAATRTGRSVNTDSSSDTDTIWCTPTSAPRDVAPIMMAMTAAAGRSRPPIQSVVPVSAKTYRITPPRASEMVRIEISLPTWAVPR